jgi:hypothetical protein
MRAQGQNHLGSLSDPLERLTDRPAEDSTMSTSPEAVVGIAWYKPECYDRIREVMADGVSFPKTHASWRQKAGRMERELRRQGAEPVRVDVDPDEFARWCAELAMPPDSEARDRFVRGRIGPGARPGTLAASQIRQ